MGGNSTETTLFLSKRNMLELVYVKTFCHIVFGSSLEETEGGVGHACVRDTIVVQLSSEIWSLANSELKAMSMQLKSAV